ncbi:MAG TPA: SMI1/KNR4 family protein [Pirellulales bacterium]
MAAAYWKSFLKSVDVTGRLVPRSQDDLEAFERELNFRLPPSYKDFCTVLGPGELGEWFNIAAPGFRGERGSQYDLATVGSHHRAGRDWREYSPNPQQFERAIIFATDQSGNLYFWDPAVPSEVAGEYAIFVNERDWTLKRICERFDTFVDICLKRRATKVLYEDDSPQTFTAAKESRPKMNRKASPKKRK